MKLCMIGTGYVGLVSGVCFSDVGNIVYCVDKDKKKIEELNKGNVPIYEPGLEEILKKNFKQKRLIFTSDLKKAVKNSDIILRSENKEFFIPKVGILTYFVKAPFARRVALNRENIFIRDLRIFSCNIFANLRFSFHKSASQRNGDNSPETNSSLRKSINV